ncbi:MAG: hypothetical protein H0U52_09000 [Chloroflexi bacterium]|nr:hypothetical protein [Chloroflexota bacterium]
MTTSHRAIRPRLILVLVAGLVVSACTGTAEAPAASPSPSAPPPATNPPAASQPSGGGGGASAGDPGSGVGVDLPTAPGPVNPGVGQAQLVVPKPGQANLHPVAPTLIQASVDGRRVLVKVTYYSGVEPCSILDSVKVERSGTDIAISLVDGSGPGDIVCIEIAVLKATIVDLGELEPGTYRIAAPGGEAPPIEITID